MCQAFVGFVRCSLDSATLDFSALIDHLCAYLRSILYWSSNYHLPSSSFIRIRTHRSIMLQMLIAESWCSVERLPERFISSSTYNKIVRTMESPALKRHTILRSTKEAGRSTNGESRIYYAQQSFLCRIPRQPRLNKLLQPAQTLYYGLRRHPAVADPEESRQYVVARLSGGERPLDLLHQC